MSPLLLLVVVFTIAIASVSLRDPTPKALPLWASTPVARQSRPCLSCI